MKEQTPAGKEEFRRGKEIGKGSFATVYLAQHRVCPLRPLVIAYIEQIPIILPSRVASHMLSNTLLTSAVEKEVVCCRQGSPDVKAYQEAQRAMHNLVSSLNKYKADGSNNETRPEGLTRLESVVADFLQSWQTSLHVEFDLKGIDESIKLNTNIWVDDGIKTDVSRKGNGLQRSLIFALIKSWAKILREEMDKQEQDEGQEFKRSASNSYFFIFEEPELFLHPHAQRELFDSLKLLSNDNNQVFITTHSSSFLKVEDYDSIVSVCKNNITEGTTAIQCNEELFSDLEDKKLFDLNQWMCPTRSELFFASKVILVEGSTDESVIPFLAKKTGIHQHSFSIINCGGKGNFPLYMRLLNSFKIKYVAVYDKDQRAGKHVDGIATAVRQSEKVESALDNTVGKTIIMENDIEEELSLPGINKSNKPYTALQKISEEAFVISDSLIAKLVEIYSNENTSTITVSIDEPEADVILGTLSADI
ncbi:MAG: hypothetical protein EOO61_06435 [Hymenobacter sp.]|nr:MAG: hypothetical protein EOO61_06435 [Hymenobacter sp.]